MGQGHEAGRDNNARLLAIYDAYGFLDLFNGHVRVAQLEQFVF